MEAAIFANIKKTFVNSMINHKHLQIEDKVLSV